MKAALAWLDTITCTAPWTLDDSRALYAALHQRLDGHARVDVRSPDGTQVLVVINVGDRIAERVFDVVSQD